MKTMNNMKKLASLLLALVMVLAMAVPAMAATITINNAANVTVANKTFNAYKILDLEVVGSGNDAGYVYTVPEAMKNFYNTRYSLTGNEGDYSAQVAKKITAETDLFAFAKAALKAAKDAGVTSKSGTGAADATSVVISDAPMGYYVIEDVGTATPISALMLDSTDITVTLKADKPSIEKKIDGDVDTDVSTTGKVDYNNAAIGDKVPYVLTSKVPDMTGYAKYFYVVTDTLSKGLSFNNDVVITIGDKNLVKDTDFTVTVTPNTTTGETTVEIVFKNFIQYKEQANAAIKITYSATVDEDAVIGTAGNSNKVKLEYSNNPNEESNGDSENPDKPDSDDPTGKTPDEITYTYVTDLEIVKVDDKGNRLEGAEFKLEGTKLNTVIVEKEVFTKDENGTYWKLKDGTYTTAAPNADGNDTTKYESPTVKYTKETKTETVVKAENVTYKGTVGSDGVLKFEGLSAGEYTITEIKAPDGYNLLAKPINVTITCTTPTGDASATNGPCTWIYTWTSENTEGVTGNSNSVTVVNKTGTELPSTGGMGTTLIYVAGTLLVAGAVIVMISKKRAASK